MAEISPTESAASSKSNESAFALAGRFMFYWASLEAELNKGIHRLLGLSGTDAFVATANLSTRDKVNLIRTLVNFYGVADETWRIVADKTVLAVSAMGGDRNFVAHTQFFPESDVSLVFSR